MRAFVTGGAGFIGSTLVDRLLHDGHTVVAYDNFSTGQERFLHDASAQEKFRLCRGDTLDLAELTSAMRGADTVFHLAANADVRFGTEHPRKDLEQNTIATFNVLEAMRSNGVRRVAFSSTGSIYGEAPVVPTPEDAPFPVQTSLYGASKLAGEGLIQAYCEGFGFQAWIFRFVSILGERYTHGHVFDFSKSLGADPTSPAGPRGRPAAEIVSLHPGLSRCDPAGDGPRQRKDQRLQSWHRRVLRSRTSQSAGLPVDWACLRDWITRAATAVGSATIRSSTSTPRAYAHSAGLRSSPFVKPCCGPLTTCRPIRKCSRPAHESRGGGTLAPRVGYRRMHGGGGTLGEGLRPE